VRRGEEERRGEEGRRTEKKREEERREEKRRERKREGIVGRGMSLDCNLCCNHGLHYRQESISLLAILLLLLLLTSELLCLCIGITSMHPLHLGPSLCVRKHRKGLIEGNNWEWDVIFATMPAQLNLHKSEENNKMQGYISVVVRFVKFPFSRPNIRVTVPVSVREPRSPTTNKKILLNLSKNYIGEHCVTLYYILLRRATLRTKK
jgi:hypothetical protein